MRGRSNFITFYDHSNLTGVSFTLEPPLSILDLSQLPRIGGGNWDNRISSFRVEGGSPGKQGGVVRVHVNCNGGPMFIHHLLNGDISSLPASWTTGSRR